MNPENERPDGDTVEVRVPADGVYVGTLRLTAASLAARCDLTIDDIEDLRLALDEACALLLPSASAGSSLDAHFELARGQLSVTATITTTSRAGPDRDSFAWTVLSALATSVAVDGSDTHLSITVIKRREAATR